MNDRDNLNRRILRQDFDHRGQHDRPKLIARAFSSDPEVAAAAAAQALKAKQQTRNRQEVRCTSLKPCWHFVRAALSVNANASHYPPPAFSWTNYGHSGPIAWANPADHTQTYDWDLRDPAVASYLNISQMTWTASMEDDESGIYFGGRVVLRVLLVNQNGDEIAPSPPTLGGTTIATITQSAAGSGGLTTSMTYTLFDQDFSFLSPAPLQTWESVKAPSLKPSGIKLGASIEYGPCSFSCSLDAWFLIYGI